MGDGDGYLRKQESQLIHPSKFGVLNPQLLKAWASAPVVYSATFVVLNEGVTFPKRVVDNRVLSILKTPVPSEFGCAYRGRFNFIGFWKKSSKAEHFY